MLQHTLGESVRCKGVGLHTGEPVNLTLHPSEPNSGIIFRRTDGNQAQAVIPARYNSVTNTTLGTTVANDDGVMIATIEHLMAAFWGCNVDNCIVEMDAGEVPIMDGSAEPFVFLIESAGILKQESPRKVIEILKEVTVTENNASVSIVPADSFSVSMEINFDNAAVANQHCVFDSRDVTFKTHLCRARTFGFAHEVEKLIELGFARGGSLENAIVVDGDKILNKDGLRYTNEFARHKALDCIGDFYLAGAYLKGHVHGKCSGHALNNQLLRALFSDQTAWKIVHMH